MKTPTIRTAATLAIVLLAVSCSSGGHRHSYASSHTSTPVYSTPVEQYQPAPPVSQPPPPPPPGPIVTPAPGAGGRTFPTPQAAMQAVAEVAGGHDRGRVDEIFGPGSVEVLWSGDETADVEAARRVKRMIEEQTDVEPRGDDAVVVSVGRDKWPFPIPLTKVEGGWRFDLEAGKDELLSRRIGRNELNTIETMYTFVEAQREYFAKGRDGNPPAYAQKVRSSPGKRDGLYWDNPANEPASPLGPLVEEAAGAGYKPAPEGEPRAFHGYRYRILKGQGANVAGGRKSYVGPNGLMQDGFAAIAWPATYGNSGIMTFVVNQAGIVFQKDLGRDTERAAASITEYDPDKAWTPAPHKPVADR